MAKELLMGFIASRRATADRAAAEPVRSLLKFH
jgi:hypothetical protein